MTIESDDIYVLVGAFFVLYFMKYLLDEWLSRTGKSYQTVDQCEKLRCRCHDDRKHNEKLLARKVNDLKLIMYEVAMTLGIDSEKVEKLIRMDDNDC
jgi:hypothetical protein